MHQVICIQTSILTMAAVAYESASSPPDHNMRALGKHYLRQSATDEKNFVIIQTSSKEVLTQCWREKDEFGCTEEGKNSLTLLISPFP